MASYVAGSISASLSSSSTGAKSGTAAGTGSSLSSLFNDSSLKKFARVTKPVEFEMKRSTITAKVDPAEQKLHDDKAQRTAIKKSKRKPGKGPSTEQGGEKKERNAATENVAEEADFSDEEMESPHKGNGKDTEKNNRTVFLGNVPTSETIKSITKLCTEFGEVESVRLRSVPVAGTAVDEAGNQDLVRKVCVNKRDFGTQKGSLNAYVVFKSSSSIQKALSANNRLIGACKGGDSDKGRHLRVDLMKPSLFDPKRSVFIGALPHYADEEEVRAHFAAVLPNGQADIENIRLVRDAETMIGKGFGYLLLANSDAVMQALTLHKAKYKKRWELRITICGKRTKRTDASAHTKGGSNSNANAGGGNDKKRKIGDSSESITAVANNSVDGADSKGKAKKPRWRNLDPADVPKRDPSAVLKKVEAGAAKRMQQKVAKQIKALKTANTRKKVLTERGQMKKDGRKGKRLGGNVKKAMKAAKTGGK